MAGRADFLVNLEAALCTCSIISTENPIEGEFLIRDDNRLTRRMSRGCGEKAKCQGEGLEGVAQHDQAFSIGLAAAPAGSGPPPKTGRDMLSGSGSGRSSRASSGRTTRKYAK